ncbi:MAG: PEGA domain-containing protein [Planctomycetota bacterium]|nr:PEGA domain-containing protein [Planctomycetota bacterium]
MRTRRSLPLLGLALAALLASGCVERLLQVRSEPPGARVFVNGQEVGETPLDHPFSFYGTLSVVLRRSGYESQRIVAELEPPWYEYFPLDFFAENLLPWTLRDHHLVRVELEPLDNLEKERADEVRDELIRQAAEARQSLETAKPGGGDSASGRTPR